MNSLKIAAVVTLLALTPVAAHAADYPSQSASHNWDGPYLGAHLGYGWATSTIIGTQTNSGAAAGVAGLEVGGQGGYNFHLSDSIVAGVEADASWDNEQGSFAVSDPASVNWDASVRGRLGVDLGEIMPYVEAGVAFANSSVTSAFTENYTGWTVGAGLEFVVAGNLSANVEYRYSDYGTQTFDGDAPVTLTGNTLRVGLNYHY